MLVVSEVCAGGDAVLEELEKAARVEKRGLWADLHPEPQWGVARAWK